MTAYSEIQFSSKITIDILRNRIQGLISLITLFFIVLFIMNLLTSNNPIIDSLILMVVFIIIGLIIYTHNFKRFTEKITLNENMFMIDGFHYGKHFQINIPYKDLKLSVLETTYYQLNIHSGYLLTVRNSSNEKFVLSKANGWDVLTIYNLLIEIRKIREKKKIYREDGTFFIEELKKYLGGNRD